jgi:hypothetical protein
MKISEFRAMPNAPELPPELGDDDLLEDYLIRVFLHGARVEKHIYGPQHPSLRWHFSVAANGTIRGEVKLPVTFYVNVQVP